MKMLILFLIASGFTVNAEAKLKQYKIRLHERISVEGTKIEFSRVLADTRCPEGMDCLIPGEFIAELQVISSRGKTESIVVGNCGGNPIVVGKPIKPNVTNYEFGLSKVGQLKIGIELVEPSKTMDKEIQGKDYILTLSIG